MRMLKGFKGAGNSPALSPHPVNLAGCWWRCLCMRAASQSRSDEYDVSTFTYLRGPFAKELREDSNDFGVF